MKKPKKKLQLHRETVTVLNNEKMATIAGGDSTPYLSKTRGTIYHCPSYPFYCGGETLPV